MLTLVKMAAFGVVLAVCACSVLGPPTTPWRCGVRRSVEGQRGRNKFLCDWLVQDFKREPEARCCSAVGWGAEGSGRRPRWGPADLARWALGAAQTSASESGSVVGDRLGWWAGLTAVVGEKAGAYGPSAGGLPRPGGAAVWRGSGWEWRVSFSALCFAKNWGLHFWVDGLNWARTTSQRSDFHLNTEFGSRCGNTPILFGGARVLGREKPWCLRGWGGLKWSLSPLWAACYLGRLAEAKISCPSHPNSQPSEQRSLNFCNFMYVSHLVRRQREC